MAEHHNELPDIREPYQLQLTLQTMNAPKQVIETIAKEPNLFAPKFSEYISSLLDSPYISDALDKLKTVRDKVIAHNEQVTMTTGPTWESLQNLVEIAKNIVGVLGWAYFSTAYIINGDYILTDDARRITYTLDSILDTLCN